MTGRFKTSVDLAAFAPRRCLYGHDLTLGSGNRMVSSAPCQCAAIKADKLGRLHHIQVACTACQAEGRRVVFYDPPHYGETSWSL